MSAKDWASTDWVHLEARYEFLARSGFHGAYLRHAEATAKVNGPAQGLAALDGQRDSIGFKGFFLRGELLAELGRRGEALLAFQHALKTAPPSLREEVLYRMAQLSEEEGSVFEA